MKLTIDTEIKQTQGFEVAAWSEEWVLDQGTYQLQRKQDSAGDFGGPHQKVLYTAQVPATLESDYFQSLFGGNAVGRAYDSTQNKGKKGTRTVCFTPVEVLLNKNIEIDETEYDRLLQEAAVLLRHEIDIQIRCIGSNKHQPEWISGHAKKLAEASALYSQIKGVMGRREYNRTNGGGWGEKDTHLS